MTITLCPTCLDRPLSNDEGAGATSRYAPTLHICSECGMREAFEGFFWIADSAAHVSKLNAAGLQELKNAFSRRSPGYCVNTMRTDGTRASRRASKD